LQKHILSNNNSNAIVTYDFKVAYMNW